MIKPIILSLLFFNLNFCKSQIIFYKTPNIRIENDTAYYELYHKYFYSYFTQKFDSVITNLITLSVQPVYQFAAISNKSKNGYFIVKYNNKILSYYEINCNKVQGLGKIYNSLLINSSGIAFHQALFKNNKLDGIEVFTDWNNGEIIWIALNKKGKIIKYLYDRKKHIQP